MKQNEFIFTNILIKVKEIKETFCVLWITLLFDKNKCTSMNDSKQLRVSRYVKTDRG